MGKRKQGMDYVLPGMILAVIVVLAIIIIGGRFGAEASYTGEKGLCLISAKDKIGKGPAYCKAQELRIEADGFHKNGQRLSSHGELGTETVKQLLADEMYDCWSKFGAGIKEPIPKNQCALCATIKFADDKEVAKVLGTEITGFRQWLEEHDVKRAATGSELTDKKYAAVLPQDFGGAGKAYEDTIVVRDAYGTGPAYNVVIAHLTDLIVDPVSGYAVEDDKGQIVFLRKEDEMGFQNVMHCNKLH
jgi:hypothetical protein